MHTSEPVTILEPLIAHKEFSQLEDATSLIYLQCLICHERKAQRNRSQLAMEIIPACFRFTLAMIERPGKECYFSKYLFLFFAKGIVFMEYIYSLINKAS